MQNDLKKIMVLVSLLTMPIRAVVVGSNTSVSLQPSINFPASDDDNTMLGFAWFKNGFTLQDYTTTCTYDAVYPVSGSVALNGGTLYLNQDLNFSDITTLSSLGNVIGNNHFINFPTSVAGFPSTSNIFQDINIYINNDFTITSSLTFLGSCIFNGNGNSLILSGTGAIIVGSNSTLKLTNVSLEGVSGVNFQCIDDTARIILEKVQVNQSGDFAFNYGSLSFYNTVDWLGSYTFLYASSQTSTIAQQSILHIDDEILLSIGRISPTAPVEPLAFIDQSSQLQLENCTLQINQNGARFTKGRFAIIRDVTIDIVSSSAATGAVVGDGNQSDDIIFELYPACTLTYPRGILVFDVVALDIIQSRAISATLVREAASVFEVKQDIVLSNVTIQEAYGATTNVDPGVTSLFQNVQLTLPTGSVILNGYNTSAVTNLLNGNQSLIMVSGLLPLVTYVANAGNTITGNGSVAQAIVLQDSNAQLIWALNGNLLSSMVMNGGSLVLSTDLTCGNGVILSGPSTVHLSNNVFSFGQTDLTITDTTYWDGASDAINLFSNITLDSTWTFSGQCVLDGNGHVLDITNGTIFIERGSHLTITNVTLRGIAGTNILCLDDAATLVLENVTWLQEDDYIFSAGSLNIMNTVDFQGDYIFAYQSPAPCTVLSKSTMLLDYGFTFSYDPGTSPDLLQFVDATSNITMNQGALLHATMQGLNLLVGTLYVDGNAAIGSEVWNGFDQYMNPIIIDNGITFGDCANAANDFVCNIAGGIMFSVASGSWNYENINPLSLVLGNQSTSFFIASNASLNSYQPMNVGNSIATFGNNASLGQAPNAPYGGSVVTEGVLNTPDLPSC
jgi:hypothetical protein